LLLFFFSSRRRHTRWPRDWSSDVCSSDLSSNNASPLSNLDFSLTYQLDPFWASLSPLSWAALVELALAGSVIAVWKGPGAGAALGVPTRHLLDRKSTRLNSSHVAISYAVFCLKKKSGS